MVVATPLHSGYPSGPLSSHTAASCITVGSLLAFTADQTPERLFSSSRILAVCGSSK